MSYKRGLVSILLTIALVATSMTFACSCNGKEGESEGPEESGVATTTLTSSEIVPSAGGVLLVEDDDAELHGASLDIPPNAIDDKTSISVGVAEDLPSDSPFGQAPVGQVFSIRPSGLVFDEPVTITLPIPPGEENLDLYIGVWDDETGQWENLGGTIDGDFISVETYHLSLYGVFYAGKSTVRILNEQELDETDVPITVMYVAGPVVPIDAEDGDIVIASRPLPPGGVQLKRGESRIMELLPGRYHFVVSYPRPQPGVANSLWFDIPVLFEGADDGIVDQTITIRDYWAESTDLLTDIYMDFPGREIVETTDFRPAVSIGAEVPAGVNQSIVPVDPTQIPPLVSQMESGSVQQLLIGPIKASQLHSEGIMLSATIEDPEGFPMKYFWSVEGDPLSGIRTVDSGTASSGSRLTKLFSRSRAGTYTVSITVYDNNMLFNQGQWTIEVIPNAKPYIDIVVDDRVIDFGRLDDQRRNNPMDPLTTGITPNNHPTPFAADNSQMSPGFWNPIPNWGVYTAPPLPWEVSASTDMKRIPPAGFIPDDPIQWPDGMTCVYAIVADADADLIDARLVLPEPIFGRGNFHTAIPISTYPIGTLIDNYYVMADYNETLTEYANRGWLPCQPHIRTTLPGGGVNPLAAFVAPIEPTTVTYEWGPWTDASTTVILSDQPRGEFPYVIAFNEGYDPGGHGFQEGDVVTEAPNPWGQVPQGTVYKVEVAEGSWTDGDAKGYLWMIPVTDDFWDLRNPNPFATIPALYVGDDQIATCSFVGQTLPIIWEAPDDPDVEGLVRDRRLIDPDTIPLGGMLNIEGRVQDSFGPQQRAFGLVAWPTPLEHEEEADLEIVKKDSPDPVEAGDDLTYTLTVTNWGPSDATQVVATDYLPSDVDFVSANPSQGTASEENGIVTWDIGNLANGATVTLTIVVTVQEDVADESILDNEAYVTAAETDPYEYDNSDWATTTVSKEAEEEEEEEEEEEAEATPDPRCSWKWYVYHECPGPSWACTLRLGRLTERDIEDRQTYGDFFTIIGTYDTEAQALSAICGQIANFSCTGGPTAISPVGPKGDVAGGRYHLSTFLYYDEDGEFQCPREYLGAYSCRQPRPDEDNDGVPDDEDYCKGTEEGKAVYKDGCPCENIYFF